VSVERESIFSLNKRLLLDSGYLMGETHLYIFAYFLLQLFFALRNSSSNLHGDRILQSATLRFARRPKDNQLMEPTSDVFSFDRSLLRSFRSLYFLSLREILSATKSIDE